MVSLPNLHFLDLSTNKLNAINEFPTVVHLRCLILSTNTISKIENLSNFTNLDMLDLHDNRISGKVDFSVCFGKLQSLRTLNLSNNQIDEVDINCPMKSLCELNLRQNKIKNIRINSTNLSSLAKMYLSNNQIKNFDQIYTSKTMLQGL